MKNNNVSHVKQIPMKLMKDDARIIEQIKIEQGFKTDSEAVRYTLFLFEANSLLEKRLEQMETQIEKQSADIRNMCWRSNDTYTLLLKIGSKLA